MKIVIILAFVATSLIGIILFTGFTISETIEIYGCKADYERYIIPNILCQKITFGHCQTTELNKYNAKVDIARCLSKKNLFTPTLELKHAILELCEKVDSCKNYKQIYMHEHFGEFSEKELEEKTKNINQNIDYICNNSDDVFRYIFIH